MRGMSMGAACCWFHGSAVPLVAARGATCLARCVVVTHQQRALERPGCVQIQHPVIHGSSAAQQHSPTASGWTLQLLELRGQHRCWLIGKSPP